MSVNLTAAPTLPDINDPATFNARALALLSWMTGTLVTEINGMDAADFFSVQSSPTDTTSGRLLKVGAFGLGDRTMESLDFSAAPEITGFFHADSPGVNKPAFASNFAMLQMTRNSTLAAQMAVGLNQGINQNARFAIRAKTGATTWGSWFELYSQTSILGTVSQSGGVVTGALIEKGNNANGYYTRWASGHQECWMPTFATAASAAATWTFPAAFISGTIIAGAEPVTAANLNVVPTSAPGTTSVNFRSFNADSGDESVLPTAFVWARGRWF